VAITKTDSAAPAARSPLEVRFAIRILILVGIALRAVQLLARRPLWLDEASLALNLMTRSAKTVATGGLDFHETAPPIFILWEHLVCRLFGPNEIALRFLPFAAGVGLLFVIGSLAKKLADPLAAVWAVAAAAISPVLIYYGNEAKQYSVDVFAAAALLVGFISLLEDPRSRSRWIILGIGGVLAVASSSAAIMVLAGITAGLILSSEIRRSGRRLVVAALAVLWIGAFILVFEVCYREYARDPYNIQYWATSFIDIRRGGALARTWAAISGVVGSFYVTGSPFRGVAIVSAVVLAVLAIGFVDLGRRKGIAVAAAFGGTCLAPFVLSAFGRLPITPRVMLFAAAPFLLAAGSGIAAIVQRTPAAARPAVIAVVVAISFFRPAGLTLRWAAHPPKTENAPPLVAEIERNRRPDEPVYVGVRGAPSWLIYSTDWKAPDRGRLAWYLSRIGSSGPAFENAPSRGPRPAGEGNDLVYTAPGRGAELLGTPNGRQSLSFGFLRPTADPGWAENEAARIHAAANPTIWLFFSHVDRSQDELLAAVAREGGRVESRHPENGADAYRFRF